MTLWLILRILSQECFGLFREQDNQDKTTKIQQDDDKRNVYLEKQKGTYVFASTPFYNPNSQHASAP